MTTGERTTRTRREQGREGPADTEGAMSVTQQHPSDRSVSVRILGIAGSLRAGSYNRRLLRAAGALLPAGLELDQWKGLKAIPPFDEDDEEVPAAAVVALRQAIAAADAVLIATPEYNSRCPDSSKTRSTGPRAPTPPTCCAESRSRSWGRAPRPRGRAAPRRMPGGSSPERRPRDRPRAARRRGLRALLPRRPAERPRPPLAARRDLGAGGQRGAVTGAGGRLTMTLLAAA